MGRSRGTTVPDTEAEHRAYVAEVVAAAPPLGPRTRETLAALIRPVVADLRRVRSRRR